MESRCNPALNLSGKPPGLAERRDRGLADLLADPAPGFDHAGEVDAGVDAGALKHVDEVFGGDVAGGVGGEGAAAEAAAAGVEDPHAGLVAGEGVGDASAAGIVEMQAQARAA